MPSPRYALYFAPSPESSLGRFGASTIGYDCVSREDLPQPSWAETHPLGLSVVTAEPRRYGFHATLKAPFRLAGAGEAELIAALDDFAAAHAAPTPTVLVVRQMSAFIVLRPTHEPADLAHLAACCVEQFDRFRAPLTSEERARRLAGGLTARQVELLERWGYPYVAEQFRFHMTLAGPVPDHQRGPLTDALDRGFAPLAHEPVAVDAISLVRQDDSGGRFYVIARRPLAQRGSMRGPE